MTLAQLLITSWQCDTFQRIILNKTIFFLFNYYTYTVKNIQKIRIWIIFKWLVKVKQKFDKLHWGVLLNVIVPTQCSIGLT